MLPDMSILTIAQINYNSVDQKFNDSYELQHLIGQGGFAMVYSAIRTRDELPV